jgi:hypothetical protein
LALASGIRLGVNEILSLSLIGSGGMASAKDTKLGPLASLNDAHIAQICGSENLGAMHAFVNWTEILDWQYTENVK